MSGTKPLIFIRPLSESLSKLHEVISETAQEEGIEIYDVDDITEVNQLLPSIGQSLAIFSNPKKCAAVLQTNKKAIHKLNSKVILLSTSSIPRKTLDKFSKIGLTECIVEPVPPKTLLYKVKLLLRSIATATDEEEQNEERKFSSSDDTSTQEKNEKQRLEKGIISSEENVIDMNLKGKLGLDLEIEAQEDNEKRKNNYHEDEINTNWEGNLKEKSLDLLDEEDTKKKKNNYQEEEIDNYLRNNKNKKSTDIEFADESDFNTNKKNHNENDDEQSAYSLKKKAEELLLEAETKKKSKSNEEPEADDKFYKGKISKGLDLDFDEEESSEFNKKDLAQDLEEEQKSKSNSMLSIESEDDQNQTDKTEEDNSKETPQKNSSFDLDLQAELEERKKKKEEILLEIEKRKNGKNELVEEESIDPNSTDNKSLEIDSNDEDKLDDSDTKNLNDIEKYMKGAISKSITIEETEEIDARNSSDIESEEENKKARELFDLGLELAAEKEAQEKNKEILKQLKDANRDDNSEVDKEDEDRSSSKNAQSTSLELEGDEESDDLGENENSENDDIYGRKDQKSTDLKLSSDDEASDLAKDSDREENDYQRLKKSNELDLEVEKEDKKYNGHTEHIQTNIDSRKGIKHQDYDWDINKNTNQSEKYEQEKKAKSQIEISFKQKVDLGEQTIDYRKLKSEFEAITITRVGNKAKKTGPTYTSAEDEKQFLKGIYDDEYMEAGSELLTDEEASKVKAQKNTIYNPKSNGLEIAIKVLNLYTNKNLVKDDLYRYVYNSLNNLYGTFTYFYSFDKNKNDFYQCFEITPKDELYNEAINEEFKKIFSDKKSIWQDLNLPTWENEKYNTADNLFFYPLYEGANKLGFCICIFKNNFNGENAKSVEVILESLRGIFLDAFHTKGNSEKYDVKIIQNDQQKSEKVGILGFFSKLFGRAS